MHLLNAFSLSMLPQPARMSVSPLALDQARHVAREATSAVGHADTARLFAAALDRPVEANRVTVALARGERALVGQYVGPRLPEGATALPEGARIDWLLVTVE